MTHYKERTHGRTRRTLSLAERENMAELLVKVKTARSDATGSYEVGPSFKNKCLEPVKAGEGT